MALVSLAVLACSCADDGSGGTASPVLATTSIWADVTEHVACGELQVPTMIPPGTDAHSYEPSVHDADALRVADLVVANGLDLEDGLRDSLATARRDGVQVVEAAASVVQLEGSDHGTDDEDQEHSPDDGHDHGAIDPHIWMDPDLVAAAVPGIASALQRAGATGLTDDQIDRCSQEYSAVLSDLSAEMDEVLGRIEPEDRRFVANHQALGHFAERFDLEIAGTVMTSTSSLADANPRELDELEATMRDEGIDTIFAEATGATGVAAALADRLGNGAEVVELYTESLDPDGDGPSSYVEMMTMNAELVADALAGERSSGQ